MREHHGVVPRGDSGITVNVRSQENSLKALSTLAILSVASILAGCTTSADILEGGGGRRSQGNQYGSSAQDNDGYSLEGEEGTPMGGIGEDSDPGDEPATDIGTSNVPDGDVFAFTTIVRGLQWVDVKMPYCGGSNGGTDYICGGTCRRGGTHASKEWDPYRTDCSGFVSWSWGLPSPGRTTVNLAPFVNDITTAIPVDDLLPGDALNNRNHIILFGGWMNAEKTKARLLEEYSCGQVAVDRIRDVSKVSTNQLRTPSGTFTAIRLDTRPGFNP